MDVCVVLSSSNKFIYIYLLVFYVLIYIHIFPMLTFRDSGIKAIENLMKKRGKFDYILLETTGLADPGEYYNINDFASDDE